MTAKGQPQRAVSSFWAHWIEIAIFVAALAARLSVTLRRSGSIQGIMGYDCGVYFAGADALIHGRMPYRDFTMVHPPGITLVLVPFAALTRWMSDWHAFVIATVAFCVLGALNAVLVVTVCRRFGLTSRASGLAGLFYASWYGVISAEFQIKLSPLENVFLLLGLLLLLRAQRETSGRIWLTELAAGALLGLTITTKIWWVIPVLLLVLWHSWNQRSVRSGLVVSLGAAASTFVVCAPFFIIAPSRMFASVITEQLGRATMVDSATRLGWLTSLPYLKVQFSGPTVAVVNIVFAVLVLAVLFLAWRAVTATRVMVALVVLQLIVLYTAPSWFPYYADYLAVGLAVSVGAATCTVKGRPASRTRLLPPILLTAGVLVITVVVTITASMATRPFTGATQLTQAVRDKECVTAVSPTVLIRLNALTRGLEAGCPNWIDITGRQYSLPGEDNVIDDPAWVRLLGDYLRAGDAVTLSSATMPENVIRAVRREAVLARVGDNVIYQGRGAASHR